MECDFERLDFGSRCRRCGLFVPTDRRVESECSGRPLQSSRRDAGHGSREGCTDCEERRAWRDRLAGAMPVIETRSLIYHVAPLEANEHWRANVARLRDRLGLFNGRRIVAVAQGEGLHSIDVVRSEFGDAAESIEWLPVANDRRLREVASFRILLEAVATTEPHVGIFYAHTKGNSTADGQRGAMLWRNTMYHSLLKHYRSATQLLRRHPCVGTTKIVWPPGVRSPFPGGLNVGNWMFAGTFFWFRADCVFSHARWRDVPDDRYGAEAWLSMLFDDAAGRSLYQPWPERQHPAPNPYDPSLYPASLADDTHCAD